ncbi:MAG TPA: low molecular weight protein-tyrosine-phosphatase [Acidobacteriota bacterium]|nr:low molecular weight protein-tyrosine-phosphatase [Acidobacteriota bacterium]
MKTIVFVCTGNICRSPTAHAITNHHLKQSKKDVSYRAISAGITDFHVGHGADERSIEICAKYGIDIRDHKVRHISDADLSNAFMIICMDESHVEHIKTRCPKEIHQKTILLLEKFGDDPHVKNVPDPYYGKKDGFERMFKLIEKACKNLTESLH